MFFRETSVSSGDYIMALEGMLRHIDHRFLIDPEAYGSPPEAAYWIFRIKIKGIAACT
jgi:hypothetical protein